jgi:hypothetical protein
MIGQKFGRWTLLKEFKHDAQHHDTRYECVCDCGVVRTIRRHCLKNRRSNGCRSCSKKTHGYWGTSTYVIWEGMKKRCSNPNTTHFEYYGGRGISVCDRWLKFENFLEDMGDRPQGMELDRIDNDGNYEKSNCRWITHKENLGNRSCSKK